MFVATLIVAGGVFAAVELTGHDKSRHPRAPTTAAAGAADFSGTYRADYGPGTDLEDKPVAECACDDGQLGSSARNAAQAVAWRRRRTSVQAALPSCRI